ncbi:MAG: hypothetical protein GF331_17170 [Chitinivibrionales bacterium]|nr:hypothetical protein [Chitinivibrionales bacterium]
MKKLVVSVLCLAITGLLPQCQQTVETSVDDTEVRITNDLTDISLPDGFHIDSVIAHGVVVGDVTFSRVGAGQSTSYLVTDEYGSAVELTLDSLTVYARKDGLRLMPVQVRDIDEVYLVSIERYGANTVVIDETLVPIDEMFGTTRVRVVNNLLDVQVSFGSTTTECDSMHLHGVTLSTCSFDAVMAGDTTAYDTCDVSGTVTLTVDSIVGICDLFGTGTRNVLVWDSVDSIDVEIDELVWNTLRIDGRSSLLDGLGSAQQRQ